MHQTHVLNKLVPTEQARARHPVIVAEGQETQDRTCSGMGLGLQLPLWEGRWPALSGTPAAPNRTLSSLPLTNWEGLLENIAFSWGNVFCPVLIRYLLNVNKILRSFTSRNKGIWNWFVLIEVHKRPIPDKTGASPRVHPAHWPWHQLWTMSPYVTTCPKDHRVGCKKNKRVCAKAVLNWACSTGLCYLHLQKERAPIVSPCGPSVTWPSQWLWTKLVETECVKNVWVLGFL